MIVFLDSLVTHMKLSATSGMRANVTTSHLERFCFELMDMCMSKMWWLVFECRNAISCV